MAEEKVSVEELIIKKRSKSPEEIEEENAELLAAFEEVPEEKPKEKKVDPDVLAKLKAKAKATEKREESMAGLVDQKEVSINLAIIGVGQAGSRIAEEFHKLDYDVGVINTSAQDLKFIDVLPMQKLLLEGSLGGTGKDLDLGREIFAENSGEVSSFVEGVVDGNDMVFLAVSGGGGTGSSSVDTLIPMLFETGMPVGVIYVLPKATEDAQSNRNATETLARLARMTADDMVSSLVVVDNARIEQIYGGLSQSQFWSTANSAIVEPIHLFNSLTAQASRFTSLDPSDFGKVISCGDCSVYGVVEVDDFLEETGLAEAVLSSLSGNMLAEGFELSQTRVGGVIIIGSEQALEQLPAVNIDYCFHMISDQTDGASIYQGIYVDESMSGDTVKIYSWFAGLGLPQDRIENLKKKSEEQAAIAAGKEARRTSNMTLDLEENKIATVQQEIHRKIKKKKSGFGKLQGGARRSSASIIDKRRKK
jgi:cell division GTPase FtsZ